MHILVDITHPAHVHFFRNAIDEWRNKGHIVTITARQKDIAVQLLDNLGYGYIDLGAAYNGLGGLALELPIRDYKLARLVLKKKPDVLTAIGGIFIAHAGFITRTPSVVFYDTEHANLQNGLTYPFASKVCTPTCYEGWTLARNHVPYEGYHELAYCHPDYFSPDPNVLGIYGLKPEEDFVMMRLVSWGATHDVGDQGITDAEEAVKKLEKFGRVLITSERPLPGALEKCRITASPELIHHLLYYSRLFIGESATMASESAVLGTPAVFISTSTRGYTNEQEKKYGMVFTFSDPKTCQADGMAKALSILADPDSSEEFRKKREIMLGDKIDVTKFIVEQIEEFA